MFAKLESLERKFLDLEQELADPTVFNDQDRYRKLTKAHSDLKPVVDIFRQYRELKQNLADNQELLNDADPDIREMAHEEIKSIEEKLPELEHDLKVLLLPTDPLDEKNIILEIRAGTGGEEAALFGGDLFRMYCRYAEKMGWKVEIMSQSESDNGGYKEVIALISGDKVYSRLKFESGTHRVQRVPATESQGRIHTSVTHIPTGLVVCCQDEKSQHKNKAKGLKILCSRLLQMKQDEQNAALADQRRAQVGTGDRSERIRTYNFPQGRVTDHRINLTLYSLGKVLEGEIQELVDALVTHAQTEALKAQASS